MWFLLHSWTTWSLICELEKKWFMQVFPNLQNVYSWTLNVSFIYLKIHLKIISLFNHLWASSLPWAELDPWLLCLPYSHGLPLNNNSSSYIFPFPHFKQESFLAFLTQGWFMCLSQQLVSCKMHTFWVFEKPEPIEKVCKVCWRSATPLRALDLWEATKKRMDELVESEHRSQRERGLALCSAAAPEKVAWLRGQEWAWTLPGGSQPCQRCLFATQVQKQ